MPEPLLEVYAINKRFPVKKGLVFKKTIGEVHAVTNVSFSINKKETLALVGESGSGKTTIGRIVGGLLKPTSGKIVLDGNDISQLRKDELRKLQQKIGIVFQDPHASLNPRKRIADVISEPLAIHRWKTERERFERVKELLRKVGLSRSAALKYPHQFSGGQLQRIAIARALALEPSLIVADEPLSALDVSVQAKIMNLLYEIQRDTGVSYLLISHDLGVVRQISHRVLVLYLGYVVESAEAEDFFSKPQHPYSQALLSSVLVPDVDTMKSNPPKLLSGEVPSPLTLPIGCKFNTRCPYVQERCKLEEPILTSSSSTHSVSCFFWGEIEHGGILPKT